MRTSPYPPVATICESDPLLARNAVAVLGTTERTSKALKMKKSNKARTENQQGSRWREKKRQSKRQRDEKKIKKQNSRPNAQQHSGVFVRQGISSRRVFVFFLASKKTSSMVLKTLESGQ